MFMPRIADALWISVLMAMEGSAPLVFGAVKGHSPAATACARLSQTLLVGGLAVGAAYVLAGWFG